MYPGVAVLLCKVPPRGIDPVLQHRIDMFNEYLTNRGSRVDNVWCIDARPTRFNAYCDDLTHFNRRGKSFYANQVYKALLNFTRPPAQVARWMLVQIWSH